MADAPEVAQGALERPKARTLAQIIADAPGGDTALPSNRMDSLDNILRDMDEKTARDYENSLTGSLAFRQEPETYLRNTDQMEQAISDSPYHKQTREEAKKFYQAISNLHFGVAPEAHDQEAFSTLEIREIARLYHRKGLITQEELDKALTDEAPAGTFFNPEGRYTREHPPAPKHFYDKSWVERAKETPQSIAGGVNHSISGFFRGIEWLQGETGVNIGAKSVATWFEENADIATRGVRADFATDLWGAVGSMMTLVVPAGGVGALGRFAGLAKGWALALEMSTASVSEALMEAGGSYNNIINEGGSIREAQEGARFSFGSNLALLLVSNRLGIYKARYDALRRGTRAEGVIKRTAKAGVAGFGAEFTQEAGQSVIGQIAESGEGAVEQLAEGEINWAEAAYNGFIGGLVGAGTSALMATAAQKIESIPELQPETQKIYQDTMNQELLKGATQEAANITATQRIAETEDGAKVIKKVQEAQEAVIRAEAAMGEDVDLPGGVEIDYAEIDARIQAGEITEQQAEDEILQRMVAPPEALPTQRFTPEQVDRELAQLFDESTATPEQLAEFRRIKEAGQKLKTRDALDTFIQEEFGIPREERPGLLGEGGFIDLGAEVSLAPVLERLRSFRENPAQGLEDLTNIGRSIWAEGKTAIEDFTARMREVLGDLWTSFKDLARQSWEIVANERGAIEIGPTGKPELEGVQYKRSDFAAPEKTDVIIADISLINKEWQADVAYIKPRGEGEGVASTARYENAVSLVDSNQIIEMPEVVIDENTGKLSFRDGRHRFAAIRDAGKTKVKITTDNSESVDIAEKVNGTIETEDAEAERQTQIEKGKPGFEVATHFVNIRFQAKEGKRLPAFMDDNPSWSEDEVNLALDRAEKGRAITEREAEIVHAALAEAGANFYQQVMESEGDFLDPKEFLEEGELDAIIEEGIQNFVSNLTVVTPVKLTQAQKARKERTREFVRRGKEIKRLQDTLEETASLLHESVVDEARQRTLRKQETKEAKQEAKRLESKIATRDKQIANLKEKRTGAVKAARAFIKERTGAELAATRAADIQGDPATRAAIKTALQAVRKATAATKKEVARTEAARVREIFEIARDKREGTARRQQLRKAIKKELRTTKPKKQAGKPVGQFTPEIQKVLDQLRTAAAMSTTEALAKINDNMSQYTDDLPPDNIAMENRIISMVHDFGTRTVPQLEILLEDIRALKDEGKMMRELQKFNRQAQIEKDVAEAVFVLTGGKGMPEGADARTRKANYERNQGTPDRAKQWMASQGLPLVGWPDVLDILSRLDKTSKPYESALSDLGDVLDAENAFKDGVRANLDRMQAMYMEAFGISNDRAGNREMMNRMRDDAQIIDLGLFFDLEGRRVPLEISKSEARKRYMEFKDSTLDSTFTEGMAYTSEMKRAITEQLTPQDIAFAEAQMAFYQEYYQGINEVYRDLYGVDLPLNPNYSPIRREGYGKSKNIGFGTFLEELNMRASTAPGGVKARVDNILPIKPMGDIAVLEQHMSEMEHFKAWAQRTKDLRAVFDSVDVRAAIETFHDPKILGAIESFMADFTRGGVDKSKNMGTLDKWRTNMARSVLAIKPSIGIKQLTSFIAYADAMPVDQFVKYSAEFWKNPIENGKMLKKDSTLLRERGQYMERDIRDANRSDEFHAWRLNPSFMNALMLNIKAGDQGAIMAGGWPLYKYHRDQGKSHEEAIRIFEKVTKTTQQSADLSDLSSWQRGDSFAKLFTTYKSSPNQYFRKELAAIRNLVHGRQSVGQTAKTVVIFHMLLPMFFQWVSDGFEWDEDEQLRAMVLGPLNGIFIAGDLIEAAVRSAVGLRDFDDELPMMSVVDGVIRAIGLIADDDITTEEFIRATRAMAETAGHVTGLPLKTTFDIGTGVVDTFSGDFEKGAYEVLGWSPYVAEKATKDEDEKKRRRR
jgi:hypothetical protein